MTSFLIRTEFGQDYLETELTESLKSANADGCNSIFVIQSDAPISVHELIHVVDREGSRTEHCHPISPLTTNPDDSPEFSLPVEV